MRRNEPKLLVIGLDCATPQFVFDKWRRDLPTLDRMMADGIRAQLRSTVPPITVPAWTAMLSSKDPGQLGFYGFRNRQSYGYDDLYFANAKYVSEPLVWNYLSRKRKTSILIGVPQTYPPRPLNGMMAACFLTPDNDAEFTYPPEFKSELNAAAGGEYIIDVKDFRTEDKDGLLTQIYEMTRRRFRAVKKLVSSKSWDFFMFVEMGIDRIHHGFWRYTDPAHRLYEPGHKYENCIKDYYRYVDKEIGELLGLLDENTGVMVVSDHGAHAMVGAISVNEWLIDKGYLVLKEKPSAPTRLKMDMIDWSRTRAWGEGGYYSRIFLNVKDREPSGVIAPGEYEALRDRIKAELEAITDEEGRAIGTKAFKPEEVYRETKRIPPDLIVYFGDLNWRAAGTVGTGRIYRYDNDTGPDDANHSPNGVFILRSPRIKAELRGRDVGPLDIYDVAPSILDFMELEVPQDMIGKVIEYK